MFGTVQPVSAVFMDAVESRMNITLSGVPAPPALAAEADALIVKVGKPNAFTKYVVTVPVRVTLTALGVVPVQLGRFDVAVMQLSAVVVPVIVTFDGGLALFQAVTAALTVVWVAPLANKAWAPASAAACVSAAKPARAAITRPTSMVNPATPVSPESITANMIAVAPLFWVQSL